MLIYLTQRCQILENQVSAISRFFVQQFGYWQLFVADFSPPSMTIKKKPNLFQMKINFGHFINPKAKYLQNANMMSYFM